MTTSMIFTAVIIGMLALVVFAAERSQKKERGNTNKDEL